MREVEGQDSLAAGVESPSFVTERRTISAGQEAEQHSSFFIFFLATSLANSIGTPSSFALASPGAHEGEELKRRVALQVERGEERLRDVMYWKEGTEKTPAGEERLSRLPQKEWRGGYKDVRLMASESGA